MIPTMLPMHPTGAESLSARLESRLLAAIELAGGWLSFDRFMAIVLYEPGLGYYARGSRQFGCMPGSGSDFVTAPELSPLFGYALARQLAQALQASGTDEVFEFGAGSGALAAQLLKALGDSVRRYAIVDLSGALREKQAERLAPWGDKVQWLSAWPQAMRGVVVGNEVLDAMPVQLLHWDGEAWLERGVEVEEEAVKKRGRFRWADRATHLRPPTEIDLVLGSVPRFVSGFVTEIHLHAEAFVRSLADHLQHGAAFFIDYGFPEAEYYHPQRHGGTLMCHRAHRADTDPLIDVGHKDITAHVNFSGLALAAQDAGLHVTGYTTQSHFLINCGLLNLLPSGDLRGTAAVQKLISEHEMGELFKVIGLARGFEFEPIGFVAGDRSHTL